MSKLVTIRLFDSLAGKDFTYAKGINEVPEELAAEWVQVGLAEYPGAAQLPNERAETRPSTQAKKAEKR